MVGWQMSQYPASNSIEQAIAENAAGPAKAAVDGQSVEQHKIQDQIEADRYLASKRAARARGLGIRRTRVVPPGCGGIE